MAHVSSAAALSTLRLYLLGSFHVERDSQPIHFPRRKVEALLAYLVLNPQAHSREKLAGLFWGDFTDTQARKSLRTALPILRAELGDELLLVDRDTVQLNPAFPLWLDVREFEKQATAFLSETSPDPAQVNIQLYEGELLADFYDDWILPERERLRTLYVETLTRLIQHYRTQSEYERAIEFAHKALGIDSANERIYQHLMFCYVASGNRQAAVEQYDKCVRALREELDVEPGPETTALANWIKQTPLETFSDAARLTNLPIPLSSFIGRKREMAEIKRLFATTRLVTFTGAGGSGKTRLAIQVATDLLDSFKDGVWWVELGGLAEESLVPQQVAKALGVREAPNVPLVEILTSFLREKQLLLVIDNCEHLIGTCAQLVSRLMSACPHLQVLATSREAMGVTGEVSWRVPTLSLPDPQKLSLVDLMMEYEGIRLFVERAIAVNRDFSLTDQNVLAIAQVCHRLDGMPLAIELAAARVISLSVHEIAARLDDRFNLLTHGSRTALPRQQTLRATIDWSYDLLSPTAQTLFRRVSIFEDGFTLNAVETVCSDEPLTPHSILDELTRLVDRSLVITEQQEVEVRYRMLETIRDYAFDKLKASAEREAMHVRHWEYYFQFASQTDAYSHGPEETHWVNLLELEFPNLRTALSWSLENGDGDDVLALLRVLGPLWYRRGYFREGAEWYQRALAKANPNTLLYTNCLIGAADVLRECGDFDRERQLLNQALALVHVHEEPGLVSQTLQLLGQIEMQEGNFSQAIHFLEDALRIGRGWTPQMESTLTLQIVREQILFTLAESKMRSGDLVGAKSIWEEVLLEVQQRGDLFYIGWGLGGLAEQAFIEGDLDRAFAFSQQSLAIKVKIHDQVGIAFSYENLARVALERGQNNRAAILWGAAERLHELVYSPLSPFLRADYELGIARLHRELSADEFAKAWAEGRALSMEQAVKFATEPDEGL